MNGYIHSLESFGAADGPGVRFVVFLQGCRMRCAYCHNPDTWEMGKGEEMSADELVERALRYKAYQKNGGGITVSGGEPLLQIDFLIELLKKAKNAGIHTVIDTAGNPFTKEEPFFGKFKELMEYTDLVLLDIKEINPARHKELTGFENNNILEMAQFLSEIGKPAWIRHVLVPQNTDFDEDLEKLGDFIKTLSNVEKVEILPYHTLGKFKWDNLNIKYRLDGISAPTEERIKNAAEKLHANM